MTKKRCLAGRVLALAALAMLCGCATKLPDGASEPLRIGTAPDYPPLSFKKGGELAGIEINNARAVAEALGRDLEIVELPFTELMPALQSNRIDIIMTGLTKTERRAEEIAFCDPFLQSWIGGLVREEDAAAYASDLDVKKAEIKIGVKKGTVAAKYARTHCFGRKGIVEVAPTKAARSLRQKRIDIYLDDDLAIGWLVSSGKEKVAPLNIRLLTQELAWGVRQSDQRLKRRLNRLLKKWQKDGTLEQHLAQ